MKELTVTLVKCEDGSIDTEASCEAFRVALDNALVSQGQMSENIALAVEAVFDTLNGQRSPMPFIVNAALTKLNATPSTFALYTEQVQEFIRANAQGEDAVYHIGKGKGGGVLRLSDESEADRKERLARQEKRDAKAAK